MKKFITFSILLIGLLSFSGCGQEEVETQISEEPVVEEAQEEAVEDRVVERGANCVAACDNYVDQCISMVPNASAALRKESYDSCMSDCGGWDSTKVNCIAAAQNCPSMTEQCGL